MLFLASSAQGLPVINELMFHPKQPGAVQAPTGPENLQEEWVELFNPDPSSVDISGWHLTNALSYTVPANTSIPAGGYLVIAANPVTFHAKYPAVISYIGGWAGELSNVDDTLELTDAVGTSIDKVHYYTEGEWAKRRQGGDDTVLNALHPGNAYLPYKLGWIWLQDADGAGKTLELRNVLLAHDEGQNWADSLVVGGSPGMPNGMATSNLAPIITKVTHVPEVPTATQIVTVTAKLADELTTGLTASVKWRVSAIVANAWATVAMRDDGLGGDENAADLVFSAQIPARALNDVVEFYVEAKDAALNTRSWPAPSDDVGGHNAPALYQVSDEAPGATQAFYRMIMTATDLAAFDAEAYSSSNHSRRQYHATFVSHSNGDNHIRYQAGVRIRGAGSRGSRPRSQRIDFPLDDTWQGNNSANLNSQYSYNQFIGSQLAHAAGIHVNDSKLIQLRTNGENRASTALAGSNFDRHFGSYAHNEPLNRDFIKHHFPTDKAGNLYTKRGTTGTTHWTAAGSGDVLSTFYIGEGWEKQNNTSALNYNDLHYFVSTMGSNAALVTPSYLSNVGAVLDIDQFLRSIAVSALLGDGETNLTNGRDDDYSLYAGANGKMQLLFHDLDTILGLGDNSAITVADLDDPVKATLFDVVEAGETGDIFTKLVPLFQQPSVVQKYYGQLSALLKGPYAKPAFDLLVDRSFAASGLVPADVAANIVTMKAFMDKRRTQILAKINPSLTATSGNPVTLGYEKTAATSTSIAGAFDPTSAAQVLVNGVSVPIDRRAGTYGGVAVGTSDVLIAAGAGTGAASGAGAVWKYYDLAAGLSGTAWAQPAFNDTAWASGPAQLGYSPARIDGEFTSIAGGVNTHFTDYFRHTFTIPNAALYTSYTLRFQRDDGAAIYLDGVELIRSNLPAAPTALTPTTPASANAAVEDLWVSVTLTPAQLATGSHTIAAEVHQVDSASSDSRFNLELLGNKPGAGSSGITLNPGINRVIVEERNAAGEHIRFIPFDIHQDTGAAPVTKGGALAASETWTAAGGPYLISTAMTIGAGVTLTIQPGATVYFASGIGITVTGTGRIVAEGTDFNRIRLTTAPAATRLKTGEIFLNGSTLESRFVNCDLEYFGGAAGIECTNSLLLFSKCTFTHTDVQYISTHNSSFIIEDSYFETYSKPAGYPPANGSSGFGRPEMLHGATGLPAAGYGIYRRNLFGHTYGFNDIIDFTGGNRPSACIQVYDNIFTAATDDHLDLDSTDTFIAGNVMLNCHQDPARTDIIDTGSNISGGLDNSAVSEWTVIGNLIYNTDHAVLAKGINGTANTTANRFTFFNNTVYKVNKTGPWGGNYGVDVAAFNFSDDLAGIPPATGGSGALIENNIVWDVQALTANYDGAKLSVTMNHNILPSAWAGPGTTNLVSDPLLHYDLFPGLDLPAVEYEYDYQRLWAKAHAAFALCPGSPAKGTGPGGLDKGGVVPWGIQILGTPAATTPATTATLTFGPAGSFNPPTSTQPAFVYGYLAYKWSLDGGAQSAEIPVGTPLVLSGLTAGTHTLRVWGKNDSANSAGLAYQAAPSIATWTVDPAFVPAVRINEVLATNTTAYTNGTTHPDYIEIFNPRTTAIDLTGYQLSDDPALPGKFVFPATMLAAGTALVLNADAPDGNPGFHLGFSLDGDGEQVILSAPVAAGGGVIDSISFGLQVPNLSIGRIGRAATWDLNQPTPGTANLLQPNSCFETVVINEWIAGGAQSFCTDFIELYNPETVPAAISGWWFTDTPDFPTQYQMKPLSFIAARGFAVLIPDGTGSSTKAQANHLPFSLDAFYDWIVMATPDGRVVDRQPITCALSDVSEGRLVDGGPTFTTFSFPSLGFTNVGSTADQVTTTVQTTPVLGFGDTWLYNDTYTAAAQVAANWNLAAYTPPTSGGTNDWKSGAGPLGLDTDLATVNNPSLATPAPPFFSTTFTGYAASRISYYFRRTLTLPTAMPASAVITLKRWIDDGYVLYLDGTIIDTKAPPTTVAFGNQSTANVGNASEETITLPASANALFTAGTHTLAALVAQNGTASSDLAFGLKIEGVTTTVTTIPGTADPLRARMKDLTDNLRITELMYDPINGTNYEFIELKNISATKTLDISGVKLAQAVDFTFLTTTTLAPGATIIVAKDVARFRSLYGAAPVVAGFYTGKLDNGGEELVLTCPSPWLSVIQKITFSGDWYASADGSGSSLEIVNPGTVSRYDTGAKYGPTGQLIWQASATTGGTPGGINAISNFATWLTAYNVTGASTDTDADGLSHLSEYALGLRPTTPDEELAPIIASIDANGHMDIGLSLPALCPPDVRYTLEVSTTLELVSWSVLATKTGAGAWSGSATVSVAAPSNGRVSTTVIDPTFIANGQRRYFRLRTVLVP
jgi:Lamin Tail Domain/CotH kinase protein